MNQAQRSICGLGGVIYNAYPRSWQDSNGDGIGDLRGIAQRLDHLGWLGVNGLWLNPIFPSPNRDWGYDVSDFFNVHPDFGTLDDLDVLIAEARRRGIGVILDLVPCHTSDEHPWFEESRRSPASRFRAYYVWRQGRPGNNPPNNWRSYFGGSAWTLDERTAEYYLHNFSTRQPQLNWWNPKVVAEFDRIYRFWFDRGVAGFRIDALQNLFYDNAFRDNPPAKPTTPSRNVSFSSAFGSTQIAPTCTTSFAVGAGWPTATTRRGCSSARPGYRPLSAWPRITATGATSCTWAESSVPHIEVSCR